MKSDFSQMHPSRSGFDSECGAFCSELILNEIKQIGCVIMNVVINFLEVMVKVQSQKYRIENLTLAISLL